MNIPHFVSLSSVHTHLDHLCFLDSLNDVAVSICVQVFVWTCIFSSLRYIPGSGTDLSYHLVTIFGLLRNCQIVFQTGCAYIQLHQQCIKVLFSSQPHYHLLLSVFCFVFKKWHGVLFPVIPITIFKGSWKSCSLEIWQLEPSWLRW